MATTPVFSDAPTERPPTHGPCPRCGFLAELDHLGHVGAHLQIRIKGRHADGKPREYRTRFDCDGGGQLPDPIHEEN